MRIGIDCRMYSSLFTGIGRYTHELVKHLIRINDENKRTHELILFFNKPAHKEFEPPNPAVKKVFVNAAHYSLAEQTRFLKKLNRENCDIVHFPHFNIPLFYRRPYTVTIHDLTLSLFPGRKMNKWFHRLAYHLVINNAVRKAKKVIAVSENTKSDIIKFLKTPEQKTEVIYNGISEKFTLLNDTAPIEKTLKKFKIDPPFLLYTGVWRDHKNLPRLIKALSILKKDRKIPLKLVITGNPDPHYPEVLRTIKRLELEEDIIRPGLVSEDELLHLYNGALFYVFPSLYEGFGFPPLESMKCGTPVVASNTSSIPEICGDCAVYFDPYSPTDMADKIASLYKDADFQADLITRGFIRASAFTWEKMADQTYNLIRRAAI